jgi:hypothetical protein
MRISVKTLSMVLAIVLSVAIAPAAWSATLSEPFEVTGTVYQCEPGSSGIQIDTGAGIITIYGMGPASYWESTGVEFPAVGDPITILVCEMTFSDGTSKVVAMAVSVDDDPEYEITLRDSDTGVPLWRGSKASLTQTKGNR